MTNLSETATKHARELGHELDPTRWSTSQRGQSNHCVKCGRFVGMTYEPEEIYGTALNASCEDVSIVKCTTDMPIKNFDELSGVDFEVYLKNILTKHGFEDICLTPTTGDQGADLIATKDGRRIAIQAKRYKGVVGNRAVQEIVAALKFYRADEGWVITSGIFSQSACDLAQVNGIRLVDGLRLRTLQQGEPF